MASATVPAEPITAEPVIINAADTQNPAAGDGALPTSSQPQDTVEERLKQVEEALKANNITSDIPPPPQGRYYRNRSRSRSPIRIQSETLPILTNTATLNKLLDTPDTLAEVMNGPDLYNRQLVYISTTSIHAADLEKISWVFKFGIEDTWLQKAPVNANSVLYSQELPVRLRNGEYIVEERREDYRRAPVPIVRLGGCLNIFKEDGEEDETAKVKFLTVISGKSNPTWAKLVVSYTRQEAMVNIFHELLNGQTLVFTGAVLKDVAVSLENKRGTEDIVFKKVASVKEMEEVGKNFVGVIC